ncbi:MAG: tyrosine recombinase [Chloroflexi bacterium]|nr:tyrosine recombinase [Chloroflexota bacterium]
MERAVGDFLAFLSTEKGFSANTLAAYKNDLTQFADHVASKFQLEDLSQIGRDHIIDFILSLKGRKYATSTVARKTAAVKSFFHFWTSEGVKREDPTENLDSPKVSKYLPKTITPDEIVSLLANPLKSSGPEALRDKAMLELLYATGVRVSELVAFDLGDVDLSSPCIRCAGKGARERTIPIGRGVADYLGDYMQNGRARLGRVNGQDALFLNQRGQRLTRQGLWLILKGHAQEAGIGDITPQTLRHSFASHKLSSGLDISSVQKILGHASITTTQVYKRLGESRRQAVAQEIALS